ncbi:50S ribosomal protein L22 [Actinomarinicola tropica]|uniref:Large ribosomal subunit protein uL22 n=1 Tax=Actinomarinicola tropica TaxID=2789776 RepID=A0A5Q2RIP5_9ACTN|nr:50S ribosomal protein L22 [Actinomarinicola tropica]
MTGLKTNERPGTRAQHRYARVSAYKARVVLDLIRGKTIGEADEILAFSERDVADTIRKVLDSAIANAEHNDDIPSDELFVSACYADEGPTLKRWRPRARGRATRIRKRTCHITVIVSRLPADELARRRAAEDAAREARSGQGAARAKGAATDAADARARRVAKSRQDKAERAEAAAAAEAEAEAEELDATEAALEADAPVPAAGEADVEAAEVAADEEATAAAADEDATDTDTDAADAADTDEKDQ